jgi:hypothetical protein
MPTIYQYREYVMAGGDEGDLTGARCLTLSASSRARNRAELPMQGPTKYELVINMKTATQNGRRSQTELSTLSSASSA